MRLVQVALFALACQFGLTARAQQIVYVNTATGDDAWDGLCEVWDGGSCGPKQSIKGGVAVAQSGDTVIIADGIYLDWDNMNTMFDGKAITVRSANGHDNCIVNCGGHARGFSFIDGETETSVLDGLTIINGYTNYGGGIYCDGTSPTIKNCVLTANTGHHEGGGVYLVDSAATLDHCIIIDNRTQAEGYGGGGLYCFNSSPVLTHCTIRENWALCGGGVYLHESSPYFENCEIVQNIAEWYGGGVFGHGPGGGSFVNTTVGGNEAAAYGGGLYGIDDFDPTFDGCILSDNVSELGPQIALEWFSQPVISYCDVQGGQPDVFIAAGSFIHWEDGNINGQALFADTAGGDFHLAAGSPCIGAGRATTTGTGEYDIDDEPRVMGGRIDLGCDEFTDRQFIFGDVNCDGVRNSFDIDPFVMALTSPSTYAIAYPDCNALNADCNANGTVDAFDIDPFVALLSN